MTSDLEIGNAEEQKKVLNNKENKNKTKDKTNAPA